MDPYGKLNLGQIGDIQSSNIQLNCIPNKLIIFARRTHRHSNLRRHRQLPNHDVVNQSGASSHTMFKLATKYIVGMSHNCF
jgi:uncharacterized protein (UPF0218 family)